MRLIYICHNWFVAAEAHLVARVLATSGQAIKHQTNFKRAPSERVTATKA
jgi:hypothetical protein